MKIEEVLAQSGLDPKEIESLISEAKRFADALAQVIPSIGFLSLTKRLSAYLVVTGQMSRLIDDGDVSVDVASIAHSLLLDSNASFRKAYLAFLGAIRTGGLGIGELNRFAASRLPY